MQKACQEYQRNHRENPSGPTRRVSVVSLTRSPPQKSLDAHEKGRMFNNARRLERLRPTGAESSRHLKMPFRQRETAISVPAAATKQMEVKFNRNSATCPFRRETGSGKQVGIFFIEDERTAPQDGAVTNSSQRPADIDQLHTRFQGEDLLVEN